jgi:hypothetical protein
VSAPEARVHWRIGSVSGHGGWLPLRLAYLWAEKGCKKYGPGTHWVSFE